MGGPIDGGRRGPARFPSQPTADQIAIARGNFQRAFDAGQVQVYDKFRRPLQAGQYALFHNREDLIWEVAEIAPNTNPNAPVGSLLVSLTCVVPVQYGPGQIATDLIVVGVKDAEGKAVITGPSMESVGDAPAGQAVGVEDPLADAQPPTPENET